jgi:hypothetical protein
MGRLNAGALAADPMRQAVDCLTATWHDLRRSSLLAELRDPEVPDREVVTTRLQAGPA